MKSHKRQMILLKIVIVKVTHVGLTECPHFEMIEKFSLKGPSVSQEQLYT